MTSVCTHCSVNFSYMAHGNCNYALTFTIETFLTPTYTVAFSKLLAFRMSLWVVLVAVKVPLKGA